MEDESCGLYCENQKQNARAARAFEYSLSPINVTIHEHVANGNAKNSLKNDAKQFLNFPKLKLKHF